MTNKKNIQRIFYYEKKTQYYWRSQPDQQSGGVVESNQLQYYDTIIHQDFIGFVYDMTSICHKH